MRWYLEPESCLLAIPASVKQELFGVASLTKRIAMAGQFSVKVLQQDKQHILFDESQLLGKQGLTHVREVLLYCNDTPVVFARTVLPLAYVRGELRQLTSLGNKSLGALLHTSRHIHAGISQVASVDKEDSLYPHLPTMKRKIPLWARRTVYINRQNALLVNEVFLPAYWQKVA